ncbi:MAG TPA: hypothetical protein PKH77_25965 [Anaerolineae bacterium]|nr:hypothetical protein [Anaerolineae bacterium]
MDDTHTPVYFNGLFVGYADEDGLIYCTCGQRMVVMVQRTYRRAAVQITGDPDHCLTMRTETTGPAITERITQVYCPVCGYHPQFPLSGEEQAWMQQTAGEVRRDYSETSDPNPDPARLYRVLNAAGETVSHWLRYEATPITTAPDGTPVQLLATLRPIYRVVDTDWTGRDGYVSDTMSYAQARAWRDSRRNLGITCRIVTDVTWTWPWEEPATE